MAHFAELDENNMVKMVIVVNNEVLNDLPFPESEPLGIEFCKSLFKHETNWRQTSINHNFRNRYAQRGFIYDAEKDVFFDPSNDGSEPDYEVS
jgi:hypothetical protein